MRAPARVRRYWRLDGARARIVLDGAQREWHAVEQPGHGQVHGAVVSHGHPGGNHVTRHVLARLHGSQAIAGYSPFQIRTADDVRQTIRRRSHPGGHGQRRDEQADLVKVAATAKMQCTILLPPTRRPVLGIARTRPRTAVSVLVIPTTSRRGRLNAKRLNGIFTSYNALFILTIFSVCMFRKNIDLYLFIHYKNGLPRFVEFIGRTCFVQTQLQTIDRLHFIRLSLCRAIYQKLSRVSAYLHSLSAKYLKYLSIIQLIL